MNIRFIKFFLYFQLVGTNYFFAQLDIKKVVIWGHKLHSHTHSYIHYGFFKAFQYLGYETYWFDNKDQLKNFDFSKVLFITEWQVDQNIPIRNDCFYFVHNLKIPIINEVSPRLNKYHTLIEQGRCVNSRVTSSVKCPGSQKIENGIYYDFSIETLYMPWATDLLPYEIDDIKKTIELKKQPIIHYVGSIIPELHIFKNICSKSNIQLIVHVNKSMEEGKKLVQESFFAPAIVREEQNAFNYIPCRIFKNISYGQWGVTNSRASYELFDKKITYNNDLTQLFYDAKNKVEALKKEELFELMDIVRDKHTYINRVQHILTFIEENFIQKNN